MGGARVGARLKDGQTNVATGAAVLAKAACRSGTWRRWGSWGRAPGSQMESFLQTFPGHHQLPSPNTKKQNKTKQNQSPPALGGARRGGGGSGAVLSFHSEAPA